MASVDDAKRAWARSYDGLGQEEIDQRVLGFAALVHGIAGHGTVSPEEFGMELGIDTSRAKEVFEGLSTIGVQVDQSGNVVGAALTALETPHRIEVAGKELLAWCALDPLFIPGLLGESALVESQCPISGETVRLKVTPEGVQEFGATEAVISVVLPGVGGFPMQIGPASPTSSQMHFFRAREAAEEWAEGHSGVDFLSIREADELAQAHWVERTRSAAKRAAHPLTER